MKVRTTGTLMKAGGDSHTRSDMQGGLEARRKPTPEDGCGGRGPAH